MASAAQLTLVEWLYFSGARDEAGGPVSSGSVYFYQPGSTSTQIQVYSDINAVPLAQPVALDAAGRAEVYAVDEYECKVLDALGATKRLVVRAGQTSATAVDVVFQGDDMKLQVAMGTIGDFMDAAAVTPPVSSVASSTASAQNPTFTFDSSKTIQYFRATYNGVSATATIANPAFALTDWTPYKIMLHGHDSGGGVTSITSVSFGNKFVATALGPCLTLKTYSADFIAKGGFLVQVTPWYASADTNG